jgi:hypothetical protein
VEAHNLVMPIDHAEAVGSDPVTFDQEILDITGE